MPSIDPRNILGDFCRALGKVFAVAAEAAKDETFASHFSATEHGDLHVIQDWTIRTGLDGQAGSPPMAIDREMPPPGEEEPRV